MVNLNSMKRKHNFKGTNLVTLLEQGKNYIDPKQSKSTVSPESKLKIETMNILKVDNYSDALKDHEGSRIIYLIDILELYTNLKDIYLTEDAIKFLSSNIAVINDPKIK